jgi:hypothetical protein
VGWSLQPLSFRVVHLSVAIGLIGNILFTFVLFPCDATFTSINHRTAWLIESAAQRHWNDAIMDEKHE